MSIEEIKKNAPEGATHYETCEASDYIFYYMKECGEWNIWNDEDDIDPWWDTCIIDFDESKLKPL